MGGVHSLSGQQRGLGSWVALAFALTDSRRGHSGRPSFCDLYAGFVVWELFAVTTVDAI